MASGSVKSMIDWCKRKLSFIGKKKARCGAFAVTSGGRCEKTVGLGSNRYCWHHTPKKAIVAVAVISAVCGFFAKTVGGSLASKFFKSPEVRATILTGDAIQHRQDVLAELGSELRYLNVVLVLRTDAPAQFQVGQRFIVSLTEDYRARSIREFEILGTVTHLGSGPNETRLSAYFHSRTREKNSNKFLTSLGYDGAAWHWPIAELPIPFAIGPDRPSPFTQVRDLGNFHVQVILPVAFAEAVERIEIVANSNPGMERRLRLFSKTIEAQDWVEMDYDVSERFWGKGGVETERVVSIRDAKIDRRWAIDLRDAMWEEHSIPPSLEGFRFQYRDQ